MQALRERGSERAMPWSMLSDVREIRCKCLQLLFCSTFLRAGFLCAKIEADFGRNQALRDKDGRAEEREMGQFQLDMDRYAKLARQAAADGCVLLENRNQALPLAEGAKVGLFGRSAYEYYKSGLGSGGLVNTKYVISIKDGLAASGRVELDSEITGRYEDWLLENPHDAGKGWGKVPWFQKEMPLDDWMLEAASRVGASVIVIGRTAGEDQDLQNAQGGFLLTEDEETLIREISRVSKISIVLLNTGCLLDMRFVKNSQPDAVLYIWQGGQEGGNGAADILTGKVSPSGHLTDTIAERVEEYPSSMNFGSPSDNLYQEDVYVGYRYFETFAPEKVLYPFGYGLSYSSFSLEETGFSEETEKRELRIEALVKNSGKADGRAVIQAYVECPQGKLGNPTRKLIGYVKTGTLLPGASEKIEIRVPKSVYASYDDSGKTGNKDCFVLEEGKYSFFIGQNVRDLCPVGEIREEYQVLETLHEAAGPVMAFQRMKPLAGEKGFAVSFEDVPLSSRTAGVARECPEVEQEEVLPYAGDLGFRLLDVLDGKVSMETFLSQIPDRDLISIFYGEGMCSRRVTPGTAAAFGGITDRLQAFGIPAGCCTDGPSGIRMDCGTTAFALPIGTMLGCSFDDALVEELYGMLGLELRLNRIDSLLGPGVNLHRNPLNGRNFEYISEDPLLSGKMGAAQLRGMAAYGVRSTVKHFCANNQEASRRFVNSVVSERALRELYLRPFEIAVKEGKAAAVMTSYGALNGTWTAGNRDLLSLILREEWGFDGIVMTDWWAEACYDGEKSSPEAKTPMILAQNDLYMVTEDAEKEDKKDDVLPSYEMGLIPRRILVRNARNILRYLLGSQALLRMEGRISEEEREAAGKLEEGDISPENLRYYDADEKDICEIPGEDLHVRRGESDLFGIKVHTLGTYRISLTMKSDLGPLAQLPVSVFYDNALKGTISIKGTEGRMVTESLDLGFVFGPNHYIKLYYAADGLKIQSVQVELSEAVDLSFHSKHSEET